MAFLTISRLVFLMTYFTLGTSSGCNPTTPSTGPLADNGFADTLVSIEGDSMEGVIDLTKQATLSSPAVVANGTYDPSFLSHDSLKMEAAYQDMLAPIASLKTSDPQTYWFIVSWLNTAYRTPNWDGYANYDSWRKKTLKRGIDCSGFARVMQDRIFGRQIRGGSQGILNTQCKRIPRSELVYGDLVFFRAPHARNNRIVHVGVYLMDGLFVHATSTRSAAEGRGLMINSLDEANWAAEYVTGGKITGK